MDNIDSSSSFQYYTIEKDEMNSSDIDILSLPLIKDELDEDGNENQILYLTFENDNEEEVQPDNPIVEPAPEPQVDESSIDVKLITLEDGRVFMATGDNLDASSLALDPLHETHLDLLQPEPRDDDADSTVYQLLQLPDGSTALLKVQPAPPPPRPKRFSCAHPGCPKAYASAYHLGVHARTHADLRPHACPAAGCARRFAAGYALKAHLRTHTGEKPYACAVCGKRFKTSGDLQKHTRVHTGERPFACPFAGCGKAFSTCNIRKVHVRSHTGERPYACAHPDCGKAFSSATNHKNHLRIHSGEKPYACSIDGCGKCFTEYSSLYKHNLVHQVIRPHVCGICGQKYKQESALNFHKRLKHGVMVAKDGTEIIVQIE